MNFDPRWTVLVIAAHFAACSPPEFNDSFESADIRKGGWQIDADDRCDMTLSTAKVRDGTKALRVSAPNDSRCEVVPRMRNSFTSMFAREPFEKERWYRFSIYVEDLGDAPYSDYIGDNTIVAQWHSSPDRLPRKERGRGPPLALRIHNNRWGITYGADRNLKSERRIIGKNWHFIGPVETGQWIDWTFRVVWSYGDRGITEIWKNDKLVMERRGPNAYNDFRGVYLKLGIYHPVGDMTMYFDGVSIINDR
ncbi:MAG: polysaccharide lyase [Pseudomonadota bacterium]